MTDLHFPQFTYTQFRGFLRDFEGSVSFCVPEEPPAKIINSQMPQSSPVFLRSAIRNLRKVQDE
jgi:hypothetical protein